MIRRIHIWLFGCPECFGRGHYLSSAGLIPCAYCKPKAKRVTWRSM